MAQGVLKLKNLVIAENLQWKKLNKLNFIGALFMKGYVLIHGTSDHPPSETS